LAIRTPSGQNPVWRVWGDRIMAALPRAGLPEVQNPVLVMVDDDATHDDTVTFSVHEDGPDFAPVLGTYKLDQSGNPYALNMFAKGDGDLWIPCPSP